MGIGSRLCSEKQFSILQQRQEVRMLLRTMTTALDVRCHVRFCSEAGRAPKRVKMRHMWLLLFKHILLSVVAELATMQIQTPRSLAPREFGRIYRCLGRILW